MQLSPLIISIVLHYHCNLGTTDAPFLSSGAPIVEETFAELVAAGLLAEEKPPIPFITRFLPTDRLYAFVEMLLATPLPEAGWIDPRDNGYVKRSAKQ